MKYVVEYVDAPDDENSYRKWIPSIDYKQILDNLLKEMKGGKRKVDWYGAPFLLTLGAYLESMLNDYFIIDTFKKHGPDNYRVIAEAYMRIRLSEKLRIAVVVLTDNTFHIREDSPTIKTIDQLISARNTLTHPKPFFYKKVSKFIMKPKRQKAWDHPIHSLKIGECREYYKAVKTYDRKFIAQYERGYIEENDVIQEVQRIGNQVPKSREP